ASSDADCRFAARNDKPIEAVSSWGRSHAASGHGVADLNRVRTYFPVTPRKRFGHFSPKKAWQNQKNLSRHLCPRRFNTVPDVMTTSLDCDTQPANEGVLWIGKYLQRRCRRLFSVCPGAA